MGDGRVVVDQANSHSFVDYVNDRTRSVYAALDYDISPDTAIGVEIVNLASYKDGVFTFPPYHPTQIVAIDALAHAGVAAAEGGRLTAPMPGKVVSFAVKAGDAVKKGQPLAVMEAMKMEHTIAAPADGTVAELLYAPGDQVNEGAELLKLSVG